MPAQLALSEMLESVATELLEAQKASGKKVMQFTECQIECAVQVEKEIGGTVKVFVLEVTGGGKKTEHNTITIKFAAIPTNPIQRFGPVRKAGRQIARN